MRPHRWQPTRLSRLWDSPGKNTGVGCHFLLQCMKVKSESEVAQSCLTLSDPMDCSLPGSSAHGIFQARVLEWVAIAFSFLMLLQAIFLQTHPSSKISTKKIQAQIHTNTHTVCLEIFGVHYWKSLLKNPPVQFSSVTQSCWLLVTPWTIAYQIFLSITNSWRLLKFMFIELVMPSNHLILCWTLLLLHTIIPSIQVFSNESILLIRRPKY